MPRHEYRPAGLGAASVLLLLIAGCSSLPEAVLPPYRDHRIVAVYEFDGAPHAIRLPSSGPDLTIYELQVEPAAREYFAGGARWLQPAAGIATLRVHCRFRSWGRMPQDGGAPPLAPRELFPGADRIDDAALR
jgi:hypothetical protein